MILDQMRNVPPPPKKLADLKTGERALVNSIKGYMTARLISVNGFPQREEVHRWAVEEYNSALNALSKDEHDITREFP